MTPKHIPATANTTDSDFIRCGVDLISLQGSLEPVDEGPGELGLLGEQYRSVGGNLRPEHLPQARRNAAKAFRETRRNAAKAFRETRRNAAKAFRETGRNAGKAFRQTGRNAAKAFRKTGSTGGQLPHGAGGVGILAAGQQQRRPIPIGLHRRLYADTAIVGRGRDERHRSDPGIASGRHGGEVGTERGAGHADGRPTHLGAREQVVHRGSDDGVPG
jgi:hypothetical protein